MAQEYNTIYCDGGEACNIGPDMEASCTPNDPVPCPCRVPKQPQCGTEGNYWCGDAASCPLDDKTRCVASCKEAESCYCLDPTCDGQPVGSTKICGSGDCAGTQTCRPDGTWSDCSGPGSEEVCETGTCTYPDACATTGSATDKVCNGSGYCGPDTQTRTCTRPNPCCTYSIFPTALTFEATQGGAKPTPQYIGVDYTGGPSQTLTATENATWMGISGSPLYLDAYDNQGSFDVDIITTDLSPGTYTDTIVITPSCTVNASPKTVSVTYTVKPPPDFTITLGTFSPSSVVTGQQSTANGTVSANSSFSGSVTLSPNCGGTSCWVNPSSIALSPGGTAAFALNASACTGTYSLSVTGTSSSLTRTSNSSQLTVNKANTRTNVSSSPSPSTYGQNVDFTAGVSAVAPGSGTPTGTVYFRDGTLPICNGTLSGGQASCSTSSLAPGNHTVTANYSGDSCFNSSSDTASHTVNPPPAPTCTLTADPYSGSAPLLVKLSWTTTNNPTSCTASGGWSGSKIIQGDEENYGPLSSATTYNLQCSNAGGTGSCSATVQVCSYAVSPAGAEYPSSGGSGSGSVDTTPNTGCVWTATSDYSWLTTSSTGTGDGSISYSVAANNGPVRTGYITVKNSAETLRCLTCASA